MRGPANLDGEVTNECGTKQAMERVPVNHVAAESEGRTSSCWASAGTCAQGDQVSPVLRVSLRTLKA